MVDSPIDVGFGVSVENQINPTDARDAIPFEYVREILAGQVLDSMSFSESSGDVFLHFESGSVITIKGSYVETPIRFEPNLSDKGIVPVFLPGAKSNKVEDIVRFVEAVEWIYTLLVFIENDQAEIARDKLSGDWDGTISPFLNDNDRIRVNSVRIGSLWGEFWVAGKERAKTLRAIALGLSKKGREIAIRKFEAETRILEAEARSAEAKAMNQEIQNVSEFYSLYEENIMKLPDGDPLKEKFIEQHRVLEDFGAYRLPRSSDLGK